MPLATHHNAITPIALARPARLAPFDETGFGTTAMLVTGPTGEKIPGTSDPWNSDARHGYSRRGPWNSDGTLCLIEQRGGVPSKLVLDAKTWKPLHVSNGTSRFASFLSASHETRWLSRPGEIIGLMKSQQSLVIFDLVDDREVRTIRVGADVSFIGEGNLSDDCSVLALGNTNFDCVLIDILNGRVAPKVNLADGWPSDSGPLDNLTVSCLSSVDGGKLVVKATHGRVFDFDVDLKLTPHPMDPWALRCAGAAGPEWAKLGLMAIGSHMDAGVRPDGHECFVGGIRQTSTSNLVGAVPAGIKRFDKNDGSIVALSLDDGKHMHISPGENQIGAPVGYDQHCSCRGPRGWVGVTMAGKHERDARLCGEMILYKLDGSRDGIRFGPTRTFEDPSLPAAIRYRTEAHTVWRRDGMQCINATNGQHDVAEPWGPSSDIKAVVHMRDGDVPPPPPVDEGPYELRTVQLTQVPSELVYDKRSGPNAPPVHPSDLRKWANRAWKQEHP